MMTANRTQCVGRYSGQTNVSWASSASSALAKGEGKGDE